MSSYPFMKSLKVLLIIIITQLLLACRQNHPLENALLFSGENRFELEAVLEHYKNDSEKLKAARFLIENMTNYYSLVGPEIDSIKYARSTSNKRGFVDKYYSDKWNGFNIGNLKKKLDCKCITSKFLIDNIDWAFLMWKQRPWNRKLKFDEFCELLLPYRVGDEQLENWRGKYYKKYCFLLDSIYKGTDIIEAANTVLDYLEKEGFLFNWNLSTPHLGPLFLLNNHIGKCQDECDYLLYVFRSMGIPAAKDYYSYCPDTGMGHEWCVVWEGNGQYATVDFPEKKIKRNDTRFDGRKVGKIFRDCFGIQSDGNLYKDVTSNYFKNNMIVSLPGVKKKNIYLGTFGPTKWHILGCAQLANDKVCFSGVEPAFIYPLLVSTKSGKMEELGYPLYFDGRKSYYYKPDMKNREQVFITRKYPVLQWLKSYMGTMVGGKFEIDSSSGFKHPKMMYEVKDTPMVNYNHLLLVHSFKGRFVRYRSAITMCAQIAEMHFFKGQKEYIPQHIICLPQTETMSGKEGCDNDVLSYYLSEEKGSSLILDFGKSVVIDNFVYMPRNDDNYIKIGDKYELFYHAGKDKGWKSLGKKLAKETFLVYNNIPKGALMFLHDYSSGTEESPFHIEKGKQVFVSGLQ